MSKRANDSPSIVNKRLRHSYSLAGLYNNTL